MNSITPILASTIFWALAAFFYAILSILKFRWSESVFNTPRWEKFSDPNRSWQHKWKKRYAIGGETKLIPAPNTWYYRTFRLKYQEKFFGSATFLAAFTDLYHAAQWCLFLCLSGAVCMIFLFELETRSIWLFIGEIIAYRVFWGIAHEYCFARLLIRKDAR